MVHKRNFVLLVASLLAILTHASCKSNNNASSASESMSKVELKDNLGEVIYSQELELRNDIPFSLLVDNEFKKKLGDSVDYEQYRPDLIFLKKGFNEKDATQLNDFGCILVTVLSNPYNTKYIVNNDFIDKLVYIATGNLEGTNYQIVSWENMNKNATMPDGTEGVELNYKQMNTLNQKVLDITALYLIKNNKLINITKSCPESMTSEWNGYYKDLLANMHFK